MLTIATFLVVVIFGPVWVYLTGFFLIALLWIFAFFGHWLGIGALFSSWHWWTVLRWGYGVTALELVILHGALDDPRSTVDAGFYWATVSGLAVSLVAIAVLRRNHRRHGRLLAW